MARVEWDAADDATIVVAHAPLPRPHHRTRAPTHSHREPPGGQEIFDEDEETEEEEPQGYHEHPDFDEDEDSSNDNA
ncbi:hypothetical protein C2845_PMPSC055717 [Panicum miliaceum]|uniref:Uncharacterized protein n=1 Tax=Panicum miliaceum TaxID=4540 RepID=A0A3L6PAN9_PANMI|nr:hypothetical protein C2845_PMPSC055717 [Panicum miliaceum]